MKTETTRLARGMHYCTAADASGWHAADEKGLAMTSIQLTEREIQVLQCLAEDLSAKEIAARLNISAKTVEFHKRNMLRKLQVRGKIALVRYAIRQNLIAP